MNNYNTGLKKLLGINDNNIKITGVKNVTCTNNLVYSFLQRYLK